MPTSLFKKKSLFSKPPQPPRSQGASGEADDAESFFSRGNEVFRKRAAEEAARKEREALQEAENDRASTDEAKRAKRARLSRNDVDSIHGDAEAPKLRSSSGSISIHERPQSPKQALNLRGERSPLPSTPHNENVVFEKPFEGRASKAIIVDLESSEVEVASTNAPGSDELILLGGYAGNAVADEDAALSRPIPVLEAEAEPEVESDPELADLKRKARENARRKRLLEDTPDVRSPSTPRHIQSGAVNTSSGSGLSVSPQKARDDPVVHYFITSKIPNTKPLITTRKFSQRLKEARLHWCYDQALPEDMHRTVVLTFKKNRVWDSTSCKGLGFDVEGGRIVKHGDPNASGLERIHLEAMTQDTLDKLEKEKHRQANADEDGPEAASEPVQESKEATLRLVLRAKGMEEFKVKARLSNKIAKLLNAFRKSNDIPDNQDVAIVWDGERLDPESAVADHDLEDMDTMDVMIG